MLTAYLILAAWFWMVDMVAGYIAESPPRPIASAALALLWPASQAFSLLAAAAILKRYRERLATQPEPPQ